MVAVRPVELWALVTEMLGLRRGLVEATEAERLEDLIGSRCLQASLMVSL